MMEKDQVEWDDVNKLLQHHGFKPLYFLYSVKNENLSDLVLLDKASACELRVTLRTMLTDSARRQALIHEIIKSNNQLKEEIKKHMSDAAQQSQRATKLEGLLDRVKTRVQDLEDHYVCKAVQQQSHTQHLQEKKQEAQNLCEALEHKLTKQRAQTAQLQRKLYFTVKEEERRLAQQAKSDIPQHLPENPPVCNKLLAEISAVVTGPCAPLQLHRQNLEVAGFQNLLPTLEFWAQQLHLLKELQQGLHKLTVRLMPWQPSDRGQNSTKVVKVEDMLLLVDSMLENPSTDDKILKSPTRYTLGSIVSHFQKLFDVTSLSGVYPRMTEVYTKLGEMANAMTNLRDILDLDNSVSPAEVVKQVTRLVSTTHTAGFYSVLAEADIDSIIVKVKQHEEFFPAFHALIIEILHTLGVGCLDDILPALKSLKQAAQ